MSYYGFIVENTISRLVSSFILGAETMKSIASGLAAFQPQMQILL